MISKFSAGCECRLFGTGLVMSENASDCTQNAAYRDRKLKNFLRRGHSPLPKPLPIGEGQTPPHWEGDTPSPNPTPLKAFGASILGAYGARPAAPPLSSFAPSYLTLLATGLFQINF